MEIDTEDPQAARKRMRRLAKRPGAGLQDTSEADVTLTEKKAEYEHLRRNLNNAMDERDQLKLMLEDIRCQFTAETRLREYLEKMRKTVFKVLSNEREDAIIRIHESLKILSSLNMPSEESLQTTGDFLTDLSYSDQETIYGNIPTSAQRKNALQRANRNEASQLAICPFQFHPSPLGGRLHLDSSYIPRPNARRLLKVDDRCAPVAENKSNARSNSKPDYCKNVQNNNLSRYNSDQLNQFTLSVPEPMQNHIPCMRLGISDEPLNIKPDHTDSDVEEKKSEQPVTPAKSILANPHSPNPKDNSVDENTFMQKKPRTISSSDVVKGCKVLKYYGCRPKNVEQPNLTAPGPMRNQTPSIRKGLRNEPENKESENSDLDVEEESCDSHFDVMTEVFEQMISSSNLETIGASDRDAESTEFRTSRSTQGKLFQGDSGKSTEVQPGCMPENKFRENLEGKHRFLLWLGKSPEMCSYCKERVFWYQNVRSCRGCGLMVHANKCEHEGQCS